MEIIVGFLLFLLFLFIVIVYGLIHDVKTMQKEEIRQDKIISDLIERHKRELAIQRKQLIMVDPYGKEDKSKWEAKGMQYFIKNHIIPELTTYGFSSYHVKREENFIKETIERVATEEEERMKTENQSWGFREEMSGYEFEEYCKKRLKELGWNIASTKKTGDQGIDLIAMKNNRKVAIQCKKYSRPVGNTAVQEVVAGRLFYNLDSAVVITSSSFTISAIQLAKANSVQLIHHYEIDKI